MTKKNPLIFLAMAMTAFVLGAFLLLVHVGTGNMKTDKVRYKYMGGGVAQPSARAAAVGRAAPENKAEKSPENILDSLLDLFASSPAPAPVNERDSSGPAMDMNQADDVNALDRFYRENYAHKFEPGGEFYAGPDSARAVRPVSAGGRSFSAGAGSGGSGASGQWSRSAPARTAAAAPAPAPSPAAPGKSASGGAAPATVFGGPVSAGRGRTHAPPPLFAADPGKTVPPASGRNYGAPSGGSSASGGRGSGGKPGGISGMSGGSGVSGGAVSGAAESMKAGAASSYNSQMAGGVAAAQSAAANSASSAPAAKASGGGSGGGAGDGAGGGSSAANTKTAKTDAGSSGAADKPAAPAYDNTYTPPANDQQPEEEDLLKVIAEEKLKGKDERYVSQDEKAADPIEALLKSGATEGDSPNKSVSVSTGPADPEDMAKLPAARKAELKKKIHTFLKRVEKKYGAMRDISCTTCRTAPDVCDKYKLKGSFLTMKTSQGAALTISVKYVKGKWRMHTVDFRDPSSGAPGGRDTR